MPMTSSPHLSGFNSTFPGVQYFHPALTPFAICISVSSHLLAWQQIMSCLLILPNEHPTQSPNPILYNASGTSENWLCITSVCGDTATCDFKKSLGQSGLQTQCNDPQWHTVSHFPQRLLSST